MDDDLLVQFIDLKVISNQILILVAMVNPISEISSNDDTTANKMATLATGI